MDSEDQYGVVCEAAAGTEEAVETVFGDECEVYLVYVEREQVKFE